MLKRILCVFFSFVLVIGVVLGNPGTSSAHIFNKKNWLNAPRDVELFQGESLIVDTRGLLPSIDSLISKNSRLKWEWNNTDIISINNSEKGTDVYGSRVQIYAKATGTAIVSVKYISRNSHWEVARSFAVTVKPLPATPTLDANVSTSTPVIFKPANGSALGEISTQILYEGQTNRTVRPPVDVVFVIDVSNSMSMNWGIKLRKAKDAAKSTIDQFIAMNSGTNNKNDRLGFVAFSSKVEQEKTLISNESNGFQTLKSEISNLPTPNDERKNYLAALSRAQEILKSASTPSGQERRKYIVFLTDGYPNYYKNADEKYQNYDVHYEFENGLNFLGLYIPYSPPTSFKKFYFDSNGREQRIDGSSDPDKIMNEYRKMENSIQSAFQSSNAVLHAVAIGNLSNGTFLNQLSKSTGGTFVQGETGQLQTILDDITKQINQASVTDVKLNLKLKEEYIGKVSYVDNISGRTDMITIKFPSIPFNEGGIATEFDKNELNKRIQLAFSKPGEYEFDDITLEYNDINNQKQTKKINSFVKIRVQEAHVPLTSISLPEKEITIEKGTTYSFVPVFNPADATNQEVTWSTSDGRVISVDENGTITGLEVGTAIVTVTTREGNYSASCIVHVALPNKPVSEISLQPQELTVYVGDTSDPIEAIVKPEDATNKMVIWSSANPSVATVDQSGRVTGVGVGTTKVIVTADDGSGVKAECTVRVVQIVKPDFDLRAEIVEGKSDDLGRVRDAIVLHITPRPETIEPGTQWFTSIRYIRTEDYDPDNNTNRNWVEIPVLRGNTAAKDIEIPIDAGLSGKITIEAGVQAYTSKYGERGKTEKFAIFNIEVYPIVDSDKYIEFDQDVTRGSGNKENRAAQGSIKYTVKNLTPGMSIKITKAQYELINKGRVVFTGKLKVENEGEITSNGEVITYTPLLKTVSGQTEKYSVRVNVSGEVFKNGELIERIVKENYPLGEITVRAKENLK